MGDQLRLGADVPAELAAAQRARSEAAEIARRRVLDPHAPNTQRAYRQAFARWCTYCDAHGLSWAPIAPGELCTYLEAMARAGRAPNTVRLHLAALCELDMAVRVTPADPHPRSLREHPVVQRWQESWSRAYGRAARKAPALERADLDRLLASLAERPRNVPPATHVLQSARDRCLVLFGVVGAFRANDLAQLQLENVRVTERGLRVFRPRGKDDQHAQGHERVLWPQGRQAVCPVHAFDCWRRARGDGPGPLFIPLSRAGTADLTRALSERQITRLVATHARRAGLELEVSAHSLRATFATLAAQRGQSVDRIMRHAGWRSADVALGYVRQAELFDESPTAGLLD